MAPNAARHLCEVIWNTERILGIEMLAAAQGIDLRLRNLGRGTEMLGEGTRAAHACLRASVPFLDRDRVLYPDLDRATALVHSGEIARAVAT